MRPADTTFQIARAWFAAGKLDAAAERFQRVLELDPEYVDAWIELGNLMVRQGKAREAVGYYDRALTLDPSNSRVRTKSRTLAHLLDSSRSPQTQDSAPYLTLPAGDNPHGKIDLRQQFRFRGHRSGWTYALNAIAPLHNRRGALFDAFVEQNFAVHHRQEGIRPREVLEGLMRDGTYDELATSEEKGITPYTRPWVGVMHNPPQMPAWFHYAESPQRIFQKSIWQRSLPHCAGLFALSHYHARWLREQTDKPVSTLILATEIPDVQFDFERFRSNRRKQIVQVGWWLRRLSAIYRLPVPASNPLGYRKVRLVPHFSGNSDDYLKELLANEITHDHKTIEHDFWANTREVQHLSDAEYDDLLAENIVFLDLYDASANNAVIECIARATPVLVNPLPAVVEYLGPEYPMYFESPAEAVEKVQDLSLIEAAHLYLKGCSTRARLSADFFRQSVESSEVYTLL